MTFAPSVEQICRTNDHDTWQEDSEEAKKMA